MGSKIARIFGVTEAWIYRGDRAGLPVMMANLLTDDEGSDGG
jgi:hypothetical protein